MKKLLNLEPIRKFMLEYDLNLDGLCRVLQTTPHTLSKMAFEGVNPARSHRIYFFAAIMNISVFDLLK